jgi:hypothetical protein
MAKLGVHEVNQEGFLKNIYTYAKSLEYSLLVDREKQSSEDANYLDKILIQLFDISIFRSFFYLWDTLLPKIL